MTYFAHRSLHLPAACALLALLSGATLASGCGSDEDAAPPSTDAPDTGGGGGTDTSPNDTGGDAPAPDTAEPPRPECEGEDGCWNCEPRNEREFLNRCNDLARAVFDNRARLPLLRADGTLPPLP